MTAPAGGDGPTRDCPLCPRLTGFRALQRTAFPDWHNAPVPSFGSTHGRLLVVGLAPGLRGANRTGRPFTGDYAGILLYATLRKYGFARGDYGPSADDGLVLVDCRITNAVRCVPPENKPEPAEIATCNGFLAMEIKTLPRLSAVLALGAIAHQAVLTALGHRRAAYRFEHGAVHALPGGLVLADSYHCSRYNTNTGRLTPAMFEAVFAELRNRLSERVARSNR
ncbi:MAG TPA: uracil-DNA glycosylase [Stellaceae bacterium]|nr:uracil-DNA glycosylase [Stellaceae bacterium]